MDRQFPSPFCHCIMISYFQKIFHIFSHNVDAQILGRILVIPENFGSPHLRGLPKILEKQGWVESVGAETGSDGFEIGEKNRKLDRVSLTLDWTVLVV